jgi:hypothetical protein
MKSVQKTPLNVSEFGLSTRERNEFNKAYVLIKLVLISRALEAVHTRHDEIARFCEVEARFLFQKT